MIKNTLALICLFFLPYYCQANNMQIVEGAMQQLGKTLIYDPAYVKLSYPNGDVPLERGVCSDVIIRALRHTGPDLQKLVHQDMAANFRVYPKIWGLKSTDRNIDHRRVPNLERWFARKGKSLPVTQDPAKFLPGDIVSWRLHNGRPHIGIVVDKYAEGGKMPLVVHNIGLGAQLEDVLFEWKMIGHYRYY